MTSERNVQEIGHCKRCKMQWVVKDGAKGKKTSIVNGQVCPDCRSNAVYYTTEDNR